MMREAVPCRANDKAGIEHRAPCRPHQEEVKEDHGSLIVEMPLKVKHDKTERMKQEIDDLAKES